MVGVYMPMVGIYTTSEQTGKATVCYMKLGASVSFLSGRCNDLTQQRVHWRQESNIMQCMRSCRVFCFFKQA